jgi:hypothetical protein
MKVHYLEIVASDVDAVFAAYEAAHRGTSRFRQAELLSFGNNGQSRARR